VRFAPGAPLAAVAVVALLLASTAPVLAADPPHGVILDAVVSVTFHEPSTEAGSGAPIVGAQVTLGASLNDFGAEFFTVHGTTDATGTATFSAVPRSDDGGPSVLLRAEAELVRTHDEGGCTVTDSWTGVAGDVEAGPSVTIALEGVPLSSIDCPPPDPTSQVTYDGAVVVRFTDATGRRPLPGATVQLAAFAGVGRVPVGALSATTDATGRARFSGVARPSGELPVMLVAEASVVIIERSSGCSVRSTWTGHAEATAAEGTVNVVIHGRLSASSSGVCGATSAPNVGGPRVTLPPTDGNGEPADRSTSPGLGAVLAFVFAASFAAALTALRRRPVSPRGS
jgi:hypothetical protein